MPSQEQYTTVVGTYAQISCASKVLVQMRENKSLAALCKIGSVIRDQVCTAERS